MPDVSYDLLREMKAEGVTPNAITYNALIHASAGGGMKPGDDGVSSPVDTATSVESGVDREESEFGGNERGEVGAAATGGGGEAGEGGKGRRRWGRVMPLLEEMRAAG